MPFFRTLEVTIMSGETLEAGEIIGGKYEIDLPIGYGGFSHVYRGVHRAMDRTVAIKIFDPDHHGGETSDRTAWRAERFQREARLISQLEHPNTVTIFDYGLEDEQRAYLVMEYIEGASLEYTLRREGPLDRDRTVTIFLQVLESLEEAHHLEILHRDLKPDNIMLTTNFKGEEIAKVLDFGIARMLRDPPDRHRRGDKNSRLFLGTPRYAAPEQLALRNLTLATDIYCVGALLWECLVGKPMVPTRDVRQCIRLARNPDPWRLPDGVNVDPDLQGVIEKAVSKDPAHRYQSASQMMDALEGCTSVARSELPDIEPTSPFAGSEGIVDPNIIEPDDTDHFSSNPDGPTSPPPTPDAAMRDAAPSRLPSSHRMTNTQPRGGTSSPGSSPGQRRPSTGPKSPPSNPSPSNSDGEFGAETLPLASPTEPDPPPARRPRSRRSRRSDSDDDRRQIIVFASIIAVMALGGVVAVAALWLSTTDDEHEDDGEAVVAPPPDDDEEEEQFDPAHFDPPPAFDAELFTIETVALAAQRFNWDVERGHSIRRLADYTYEHMRLVDGDDVVDLHVYETASHEVMAQRKFETSLPDVYIILGSVFIRISPDGDDADAAVSARKHLQEFRDLVLKEAGYD